MTEGGAAADASLVLSNALKVPMSVKVALKPADGVTAEPAVIEKTLAPGTTEEAPVRMSRAAGGAAFPTLPYEWSARVTLSDGREVRGAGKGGILIEPKQTIAPAAKPVTVDGDLSEWDALPFSCDASADADQAPGWTGPADASFRFGISYDDDYVYVAVESTDDRLVLDPARSAKNEDGVALLLDARDAAGRRVGIPRG